jgi:hypothetical protein
MREIGSYSGCFVNYISARDLNARPKPKDGGLMEVKVTATHRRAMLIKSLKGEIHVLAQGRPSSISLPNVIDLIGHKLDEPLLKAAQLEVTILDPKEARKKYNTYNSSENVVCLMIAGPLDHLGKITVVDKNGELVGGNTSSSTRVQEGQLRTLILKRPPENTMRLKLEVFAEEKIVTVPFDLKDLELP